MQDGYITALAALGGSVLGSATSLATTWLTQHGQLRVDRAARESAKRETLYGQFIDEAARLYAEVLRTEYDDPALLVKLTAMHNRMRLFASTEVLRSAERVITSILELNSQPSHTLRELVDLETRAALEPMREFGERCRAELDQIG